MLILMYREDSEKMNENILVFSKTTGIVETMRPFFEGEGYNVYVANDFEVVLQILRSENIHLLLIAVELEQQAWNGRIEMLRYLRTRTAAPIIAVSSETAEMSQITALNVGADDYVTAEANPLVLLARVKAQLRRYIKLENGCKSAVPVYRVGNLEVDDRRHLVTVEGKNVKMTPTEYKILHFLIQERGKVFSIKQIYESIWQMQAIEADNTVAVHIRHIREKIENNPKEPCYLKVVRGVGYKVG